MNDMNLIGIGEVRRELDSNDAHIEINLEEQMESDSTCKEYNAEEDKVLLSSSLAPLVDLLKSSVTSESQQCLEAETEVHCDSQSHCIVRNDDIVYDVSALFSDIFQKSYESHSVLKKGKRKRSRKSSSRKLSIENVDNDEESSKATRRKRPNYFVAVQISNEEIHERLKVVQEAIISLQQELESTLTSLPTLHLTLGIFFLDKETIESAKSALDKCKDDLQDLITNPLTFDIQGVGNFRNNVVFAKIIPGQELDRIAKIAEVVATRFEEHGIMAEDKREFNPHITLLKLFQRNKKPKGIKNVDPGLYSEFKSSYFGRETVASLQLCSMQKRKGPDGYYYVEHTCHLNANSLEAQEPAQSSTKTAESGEDKLRLVITNPVDLFAKPISDTND